MNADMNLKEQIDINDKVQLIKKTAEELCQLSQSFPAVYRNTLRILASTKMLELNISDIMDLEDL
jgi:hypothetical protein